MNPLLEAKGLSVWYPLRGGVFATVDTWLKAVRNVDVSVNPGEIVAIVGESGCGKSTLAQALVGLRDWKSGSLMLQGKALDPRQGKAWKEVRSQVQMVFQDPNSSLNPRQTVQEILTAPQAAKGISRQEALDRALDALQQVGLGSTDLDRYPFAFSGGQRQRIGIARALALQSKVLICDEPTSALDVSVQAQILQLLQDLRERLGLGIVLISHDLSVVRALADRVLVMYLGSVVEEILASELHRKPRHPYTKALLSSVPSLDPEKKSVILKGEIPSLRQLPRGCVFQDRCSKVREACRQGDIPLEILVGISAKVRCPFHSDMA